MTVQKKGTFFFINLQYQNKNLYILFLKTYSLAFFEKSDEKKRRINSITEIAKT